MTGREAAGPGREAERLLGPLGPELGCDECFEQLDVYVELELAGGQADAAMPAMREHLTGCPACRDEYDTLLAFIRANPELGGGLRLRFPRGGSGRRRVLAGGLVG